MSRGSRPNGLSIPLSRGSDRDKAIAAAGPSWIARGLDFASDWALLAFAAWTLIAYGGMVTEAKVSLLVPIWLATAVLLGFGLVVLSRGRPTPAPPRRIGVPGLGFLTGRYRRPLLMASVAAGAGSALLAAATQRAPWSLVWVAAVIAVALAVAMVWTSPERPMELGSQPRWAEHAFAALVGLGFAAMSLFINRPNADDAFYVNRATATAQLNRIPVRDVLFTDERVAPTSAAGLPVDTFSALQGALGRFFGIHGASFAYYVTPPLMTFLATWALWRLLRAWAPRNLVLCFALGCVYWVFSAQSSLTAGSYFLSRMWQGKVIFVAWLVLIVYTYLTRWLARRDALTAVLLLAAGLSSIGMTGSAAFVAPLLFATAALPLVVRREWRGLPVLIAASAIPFLIGFVATRKYPLADQLGGVINDPSWYFHEVVGVGLVGVVGAIGVWSAPWLARSGPAARLTGGIAAVSLVVLIPGLLPALSEAIDLGRALRRMLWIIPLPAVVGLLGALPLALLLRRLRVSPLLHRVGVATPAFLVAGLLVAFGDPLWKHYTGESFWVSRPTWKTNQNDLAYARAILTRYRASGAILAREPIMRSIALVTVQPKAVNARRWYAKLTPEPYSRIRERVLLTEFVAGAEPRPSRREVRRALSDLRVGLVCVQSSKRSVIREVELTGRYREAFRVRDLVCLRRE